LTFVDENNIPLANKTIIASIDNGIRLIENIVTDWQGRATFDLLTTQYIKAGNSVEEGGISGTPTQIDYANYTFILSGSDGRSEDISIDELKGLNIVMLNVDGSGGGENPDLSERFKYKTFEPTGSYYVATNGSDTTGDGSEEKPWRTINYALKNTPIEGGFEIVVGP
jgi:hypothetical protein